MESMRQLLYTFQNSGSLITVKLFEIFHHPSAILYPLASMPGADARIAMGPRETPQDAVRVIR